MEGQLRWEDSKSSVLTRLVLEGLLRLADVFVGVRMNWSIDQCSRALCLTIHDACLSSGLISMVDLVSGHTRYFEHFIG